MTYIARKDEKGSSNRTGRFYFSASASTSFLAPERCTAPVLSRQADRPFFAIRDNLTWLCEVLR